LPDGKKKGNSNKLRNLAGTAAAFEGGIAAANPKTIHTAKVAAPAACDEKNRKKQQPALLQAAAPGQRQPLIESVQRLRAQAILLRSKATQLEAMADEAEEGL
jgi:hypothetical protein